MLGTIFIFIAVTISVIVGIHEGIDVDISEGIKSFIAALCASFFILGVIFASTYGLATDCFKKETTFIGDATQIKGLQYESSLDKVTQGTFILGCGSFSSKNKVQNRYYFFIETEFGAKLETVDSSQIDVYLKETDDENPNIKIIYTKRHFEGFWEKLFGECEDNVETGKIITVPTNTIKIDYNVKIGE